MFLVFRIHCHHANHALADTFSRLEFSDMNGDKTTVFYEFLSLFYYFAFLKLGKVK